MNRINQGKVTHAEIANPDRHAPRSLSASTAVPPSRERERVAKPDEVFPESGERTEASSRILLSAPNSQLA
jgi:hypothetical protein